MQTKFRSALPLTWLAAGLTLLAVSLTLLAAGPASSPLEALEKKATVHCISGPREDAAIPRPVMNLIKGQVAVVITDPQNDFLSPKGVAWGVVGKSVTENNTVANIESLFKAVKSAGVPVFISPHYYYKHDHQWKFQGALEKPVLNITMFDRKGALELEGCDGSGAGWLELYKSYIDSPQTKCPI